MSSALLLSTMMFLQINALSPKGQKRTKDIVKKEKKKYKKETEKPKTTKPKTKKEKKIETTKTKALPPKTRVVTKKLTDKELLDSEGISFWQIKNNAKEPVWVFVAKRIKIEPGEGKLLHRRDDFTFFVENEKGELKAYKNKKNHYVEVKKANPISIKTRAKFKK